MVSTLVERGWSSIEDDLSIAVTKHNKIGHGLCQIGGKTSIMVSRVTWAVGRQYNQT